MISIQRVINASLQSCFVAKFYLKKVFGFSYQLPNLSFTLINKYLKKFFAIIYTIIFLASASHGIFSHPTIIGRSVNSQIWILQVCKLTTCQVSDAKRIVFVYFLYPSFALLQDFYCHVYLKNDLIKTNSRRH